MAASSHTVVPRPPVVTVMGHIDHGKSTLLDYIRKTRVTETEAGGITQHLSAYEVVQEHEGAERRITFLDTPGHEAVQHLRSRGSSVADRAILVIAADDGVKPQTLEALKAIITAHIPYIVAFSKIDKPNANLEKAKSSCLENGIYLEGLGGDVPYTPVSSKTGEGIHVLLDLLLLSADLENLTGSPEAPATGLVIESNCDPKRGISATLVIKNGTLRQGEYVVAGQSYAPLRIVEDFRGVRVKEASFSSPVTVVGFTTTPPVGATFTVAPTKKAAEKLAHEHALFLRELENVDSAPSEEDLRFGVPVVVKADVVGSLEAIRAAIMKYDTEHTRIHIVRAGVGSLSEADVKSVGTAKHALIVGFNIGVDAAAEELALRLGVSITRFRIIYELIDWLPDAIRERRPARKVEEVGGTARVVKFFSRTKDTALVGCRMVSGAMERGGNIRVLRDEREVGRGVVTTIQQARATLPRIEQGEFGAQIESEANPSPGDTIELINIVEV